MKLYDSRQAEIESVNTPIEDAIHALEQVNNEANIYALIDAMRESALQNGQFFIPVLDADELENPGTELFQVDPLDLEGYLEPPELPAAMPRKVELYKGGFAFTAFTSREELDKGEGTKYTSMPIPSFFELAMQDADTVGVVLNPWGVSVLLDQRIMQMVLQPPKMQQPVGKLYVDLGDITKLETDAIVNAANTSLVAGGGVCGAIFSAAGPGLQSACAKLGGCEVGKAKITDGFDLPAKYIIHTPGPVYSRTMQDAAQLSSCYTSSLDLAKEYGLSSIAFPAISTGIYGYPLEEAIPVAMLAVTRWVAEHPDYPMEIHLVCYDEETYEMYTRYIEGI